MRLTTGKRTRLEAEYQAEVNRWAKLMGQDPPIVRIRQRHGGIYRRSKRTISIAPECSKETLVHEFAHHLSPKKGHGPAYRIALVEAATIAYGRAFRYPLWAAEYLRIASWARRHMLC